MITHRQLFLHHIAPTSDSPLALEIERAEGVYLYGTNGQQYMDLISGIAVSNLGHRHPKVVEATKTQLDQYMHLMVYGEYIQSPQVKLAKLLTDNLPENLEAVYFVNSGTEATEGALKLAKRYTGRTELISCVNAYHGSTHGAVSIMGSETYKNAFRPLLPDTTTIEFNNEADIAKITDRTACVLMEPVQGEAGVRLPENNYLQKVRARCNETGTLLIFDEVQTGFGRTGSLFAFEQYDVVPDIITLAKGLGGGMPLGCFISSSEILNTFTNNPILGHLTTFGGHPVCCAASLATLEILLTEDYIQEAAAKGELFKSLLQHSEIKEVRGKGLMLAAELRDFEFNERVIKKCVEKGLITDWFLFCDNSLRIAPPLIITEDQIREACAIILESIDAC
jgi:acetylornithine/N-succinyldiaminopimelate aminotransferase